MQGNQLRKLEAELWRAADQLRANSKLTASEYSMPVLGLIFLRHAFNRFQKVKVEIEKDLPVHPQRGKRSLNKKDFEEKNSLFLPEKSQFEYLVNLPESADIGDAIDNAMKAIEDEYDNLVGVLPRNFTIFSKDLLRELLRIFNKEVLQKAEGDLFGKIYEYFLNKFAMTGAQEGGEFFTPMSLVQTIVNVIEPDHGIVFDPACGSAGMFVQTGYFIESEGLKPAEKVSFYGQEKAELNTKLAKMNLAVHGLEGKIQEGNTFYEDKHDLVGKADFVMANPPFNVDGVDKAKDVVKKDPRLMFNGIVNLPKNDNANYLWIQYFYNYLKPTGRAGFVMASSASDAGHSEKDIREKLVNTGAVDVMMTIGNNFFYTRSLPCTLWFFDRAKENDKAKCDKVLMLDAISTATKEYQLNKNKDWKDLNIQSEFIAPLKTLQQLLSGNPDEEEPGLLHETEYFYKQAHWLTSRFPDGVYTDVEGLCKVVSQAEIEAKDWSLSPGRYVGVDTATDDDFDYEERLNEIHIELEGLNEEAVVLAKNISENYKELAI